MKICFVTKSDFNVIKNIGRIRELPKELKKIGNSVSLISAVYDKNDINKTEIEGLKEIKLIPIGNKSFGLSVFYVIKLFWFFITNSKYVRTFDFIVLDYTSVFPLHFLILLSTFKILRANFILDVRTIPVDVTGIRNKLTYFEYDLAVKFASVFCKGITVITEGIKKDVLRRSLNKKVKIGIWTSGVSLETFDYKVEPIKLEEFLKDDDFVLIHHGVLSLNRGIVELVYAMQEVVKLNSKIKLLIIGDGPAYSRLSLIIKEHNLENNVLLTGKVPYNEISKYIARCNAGIIPLPDIQWWRVSSPQKLFEYLAMGKNVIVSDIEAHRNVLKDANSAIYINSLDKSEISNKILKAEKNWTGREINNESINFVKSFYTWSNQAQILNDYFGNINLN